jgi:hypothetical protein
MDQPPGFLYKKTSRRVGGNGAYSLPYDSKDKIG